MPESYFINPRTGKVNHDFNARSPTSYWAPFVIHIGHGVTEDPLTFAIPDRLAREHEGRRIWNLHKR